MEFYEALGRSSGIAAMVALVTFVVGLFVFALNYHGYQYKARRIGAVLLAISALAAIACTLLGISAVWTQVA